jgi:hypothetical protein
MLFPNPGTATSQWELKFEPHPEIYTPTLKPLRHSVLLCPFSSLSTELNQETRSFINRTLVSIAVGEDKSLMYESEKNTSLLDALR